MMYDQELSDPEIDIQALLGNIDYMREVIVKAAPDLQANHHNYVRVSAIEQLITKALGYVRTMK